MANHTTRLLLLVCLCAGLFACGQRGPLYLPDEPQQDRQQDAPRQTP